MNRPLPSKDGHACVGVVSGAHGIRGAVVIKLLTDDPADLIQYGTPVNQSGVPIVMKERRHQIKGGKQIVIATFDGVTTRESAEALRGTPLFIPLSALPELDEKEAYTPELIGVDVVLEDGSVFGKIKQTFQVSSQVNLVVRTTTDYGADEVYLPFVRDVVIKFNREEKQLVVTPFAKEFVL